MGIFTNLRQWLHSSCERERLSLLRDIDRTDSELLRLRKQHEALLTAYQESLTSLVANWKPTQLWDHLFTEVERPADTIEYLTPAPESEESP